MYIDYGGTLQGAGTVQVSAYVQTYYGSIEFSGILDTPQLNVQNGNIDPAGISATSILNSGSLSLWYGTLRMQFASDADYDQVNVAGVVDLGYSTLELTVGYTPIIGQQFTLINNDDTDAVVGTFNNQPEGSLIATDNNLFRISYVGGDGNDVVLTRMAAGFWSGGAVSSGSARRSSGRFSAAARSAPTSKCRTRCRSRRWRHTSRPSSRPCASCATRWRHTDANSRAARHCATPQRHRATRSRWRRINTRTDWLTSTPSSTHSAPSSPSKRP